MTDIRTDPDPDAAAAAVEAIATGHEGSLSEQFQNYFSRVRSGEMGMLPALAGVLVLGVLFSFLSEFFLTNKNIANLLTQTASLMILAIALTFLLIMAEIDLSAGITGGVGMAVFIRLLNDQSGLGLFLYLALNKSKANLALARHKLTILERQIEI